MKQNKWILPLLVIVGVVSLLFWAIPKGEPVIDQIHKIEIEELKRENDALKQSNDALDDKVLVLETFTDSLMALMDTDKQTLKILKQKKDEKVSAIDNFTDDELYQYFAGFNAKGTTDRE